MSEREKQRELAESQQQLRQRVRTLAPQQYLSFYDYILFLKEAELQQQIQDKDGEIALLQQQLRSKVSYDN